MPDDRHKPKHKPLLQPAAAVPESIADREDITGQYDTSTYEGKAAEAAARLQRTQKDAELAAIGTTDIRARMGDLEQKHDALSLVVARQDGKLDAIMESASRSDAERERRADREAAERQADAERKAAIRKLLLHKAAPIIAALSGLIAALRATGHL